MRLTTVALLVIAALVTSACESGPDPHAATAPSREARNPPATFRACSVPSGGFRVRAFGLRCDTARKVVRHFHPVQKLREFRLRDPNTRPVQVSREVVWRAAHRWTCLAQGLPRVRVSQFLCVRGRQVLLWRVA